MQIETSSGGGIIITAGNSMELMIVPDGPNGFRLQSQNTDHDQLTIKPLATNACRVVIGVDTSALSPKPIARKKKR